MPKVVTQDLIDKIAEFAGRGYSKSATGRELNLDRATIRKYWPKEREERAEEARPSIEEEFRLLTKRGELRWDIGEILSKIDDRKWETRELSKQGQLATESVKFLKEKVEKVETLGELDSIFRLVKQKQEELTPALDEDDKLRKQRLEREEKERQEEAAKRRKGYQTLKQHFIDTLPWYIPCPKYAKSVVNKFQYEYGYDSWARVLGSQLAAVNELKWESDIDKVEPLCHEFVNIIRGHPEEKEKIRDVMSQRRERILTAHDEDAIDAFDEWLNFEEDEEFVEGALKLNGIFKRLAEETYIDIDELLEQEASRKAKVKVKQK
jgi:hypothetical protein